MNIGYARVSTNEQNLDSQEDALKKMNCVKIFSDKISGKVEAREGLLNALSFARPGDSIVVFSLSRLGRSLKHLIEIANELERRQIGLISLTEQIDTSTPTGKLLFHLLASLAQFEADLIKQRTMIGLQAARDRGRTGGRPKKINANVVTRLNELLKNKDLSKKEIAKILEVSPATIYRVQEKIAPT
jgi:DNA invertase Pin-like site-specific DNA recombinase